MFHLFEFTVDGKSKGGGEVRSDYAPPESMRVILAAMMPANRLALTVSLITGLRISDVLSIKTAQLQQERFTVREQKTQKSRRIRLPDDLREQLLRQAGRFWVFEGRTSQYKHRTRQAVYTDLKRACKAFRITGLQLSPHSARKIYSVGKFRASGGNLERVKELLNHEDEAVTILYAMADVLTARHAQNSGMNLPAA